MTAPDYVDAQPTPDSPLHASTGPIVPVEDLYLANGRAIEGDVDGSTDAEDVEPKEAETEPVVDAAPASDTPSSDAPSSDAPASDGGTEAPVAPAAS